MSPEVEGAFSQKVHVHGNAPMRLQGTLQHGVEGAP